MIRNPITASSRIAKGIVAWKDNLKRLVEQMEGVWQFKDGEYEELARIIHEAFTTAAYSGMSTAYAWFLCAHGFYARAPSGSSTYWSRPEAALQDRLRLSRAPCIHACLHRLGRFAYTNPYE
jgi:hypothetical protein